MHRTVVLTVALAAVVAGLLLGWVDVRQEREFRRLIAVGDAAVSGDDTAGAIEAFSGAIALKSESMLAYLKRGDTYRRRGELGSAMRDLRQAMLLDPTAPKPIELLGDVYALSGEHDRAADLFQRYLALDDRAPVVLYKLGLANYRRGRADHAIEPLRRALVLDGRLASAHYVLGMAQRSRGNVDAAATALTTALEIDPTLAAARQELAELFADIGRNSDGIGQLEALAALEPARPERIVSVGLAFSRLGRHEAAIVTLNRAAERHPDSPLVASALGRAWLAMAESGTGIDTMAVGRAAGALREMAARPDASGDTLALYGRALLMAGDAAGAERTLQLAVTRLPVEPAAFKALADAATRLGHAAIARRAQADYALF